jgi:hypothetical protein
MNEQSASINMPEFSIGRENSRGSTELNDAAGLAGLCKPWTLKDGCMQTS